VTAILAPGLFGPAPPAANAPPAPAGEPGPAGTFAALLSAIVAAQQTGGEPLMPPPGGEAVANPDLATSLTALWALWQGKPGTPPLQETTQETEIAFTPDRTAEAETEVGTLSGLEALMAQFLVLQRTAEAPVAKVIEPPVLDASAPPDAAEAVAQALAVLDLEGRDGVTARAALDLPGEPGAAAKGTSVATGLAELDTTGQPPAEGLVPVAEPRASVPVTARDVREPDRTLVPEAATPAGDGRDGSFEAEHPVIAVQPAAQAAAAATRVDLAPMTGAVDAGTAVETVAEARAPRPVDPTAVVTQVADTVVTATLRGDHEVRLVLNPPDLGTVDVRIVEVDGDLRIRLEATLSGTRDVIEQQLPGLRAALEARDLRVERIEVRHAEQAASGGQPGDTGSGARGGGERGSERPEWSPVAWLQGRADDRGTPAAVASADGRLDVLA
jgi:flagellar hook-length control protein FliK